MKKSSFWFSAVAVPLVVGLGVWALATIHLQTELLPLFPAKLPSVRGVRESMSIVSSAQNVTIVLTPPAATTDVANRLESELNRLPEVQAVSIAGRPQMEPLIKMAAWTIANLPPKEFAEFQSMFGEAECTRRLQDTRDQLSGAVDAGELVMLRLDPLQLLPWLKAHAHQALPLPDLSPGNAPSVIVAQVRARRPLRTFDECQDFVARIRQAVDAAANSREIRQAIYITGQPAFVAENSGQMKFDMTVMVLLATGLTSLLVWAFYRSWTALVWMAAVLVLALLTGTVAARVLFHELNVISIGFASILIGLGSDYCILVYHFYAVKGSEAMWRTARRGIWISAFTTSLAFGTLYFSSFPGLQQLVVLIGAGLLATAFFATTLLPEILQRVSCSAPTWLTTVSDRFAAFEQRHQRRIVAGAAALLIAAVCLWPLARRYKFYDPDFNRLRPAHSEANRGVELLMELTNARKNFDVIVSARSWDDLRAKAARVSGDAMLMPQTDFLETNRRQWTSGQRAVFSAALDKAGFEESWGAATAMLLETMDAWAIGKEDFESPRLFLSNVVERPDGGKVAMLRLPMDSSAREMWTRIEQREPSSLPASWPLMMEDLQRGVLTDARKLSLWMLVAVVGVCWWARRSWAQVAWNGVALALTFVGLLALLLVTRESMTLHSLLTVPVMVAVSIEYSLYLLLGMETNAGDLKQTFRQLAVPVFLMGATTIIGFGAPVATHQPVLQNFGMVMAMGTFAAMATGLLVVPALDAAARSRPHYSQVLYRAFWFTAAERYVRLVGRRARATGAVLGSLYRITHPRRERVVRKNLSLLTAQHVNGEAVRRTFANYGRTLADYFLIGTLPKREAQAMARERVGFEHLKAVFDEGKGALLVTAHLGLFEFGGVLMEEIGHPTIIVTLPEPSAALSEWRAQFRKRWGAETLEVGADNFSFVEITRRLSEGRCVAMLMDRPYDGNCVLEEFPHGNVPFSTGPVWLSLLSGSPIIAVTVVGLPTGGYRVEAHPPIRPQWLPEGRDESVRHYTKQVAAIFRETICKHPDQWYQFVDLSSRH